MPRTGSSTPSTRCTTHCRRRGIPSPVDRRDSRAVIQAAADAYLNLFKNGPGSVAVPWADNCRRLEGGLYTAPGDTCNSGVPSGIDLVNRRYVIDESLGTVDVFLTFGGTGSRLPDSHEFRVEGGKIRYVHTITVCPTPAHAASTRRRS